MKAIKHKKYELYGQWMFNSSADIGWQWLVTAKPHVLYREARSVFSLVCECGPHTRYALDFANYLKDEYELVDYEHEKPNH